MAISEGLQRSANFPFRLDIAHAELLKPFRRPRPPPVLLCRSTTAQCSHYAQVVTNGAQWLGAEAQREALVIVTIVRIRVGMADKGREVRRTAVHGQDERLGHLTVA